MFPVLQGAELSIDRLRERERESELAEVLSTLYVDGLLFCPGARDVDAYIFS